jgi:hypothetical protein
MGCRGQACIRGITYDHEPEVTELHMKLVVDQNINLW